MTEYTILVIIKSIVFYKKELWQRFVFAVGGTEGNGLLNLITGKRLKIDGYMLQCV